MKINKIFFGFFLLLLILIILLTVLITQQQQETRQQAVGNVFYVSPNGSDSNGGSQSHPFATINKAASVAIPGTTIHVLPGTYSQTITTNTSGTATARITYISDVRGGAIITANADSVWRNMGRYIDIIGFDITGSGARIGLLSYGSNVNIIGNHVHHIAGNCSGSGGAGIDPYGSSAYDTNIIGNVVNNVGSTYPTGCPYVHGIYDSAPGGHIWNNITYNNAGNGIITYHAATGVVIANNLSFANGEHGIGIGTSPSENGGVIGDNFIVANNISIYNSVYGITEDTEASGSHNHFLNNLVYGNRYAPFYLLGRTTSHGINNQGTITADPQLVNYQPDGSGDYHLKPTSPAIDAGTSIGAPATDFDGQPRPQGKGIDIGPYEYGNGGSLTLAPTLPQPSALPTVTLQPRAITSHFPSGFAERVYASRHCKLFSSDTPYSLSP